MDAALYGLLSAFSFGTADFIARFTGRRLEVSRVLLVVLAVGLLPLMLSLLLDGHPLVPPSRTSAGPILLYGAAISATMLLLYQALARGPVTIVAPIVAAHPALVIALAVLTGSDPAAAQWLAMAAILAGVVVTARCADEAAEGAAPIARSTLMISLAAAIAYAVMVSAGQAAVPLIGDAPTAWWGRLTAVVVLLAYMAARSGRTEHGRPEKLAMPSGGVFLLLGAQGLLDGGGHLLLFLGSHGAHPEVAAVAASTFGAITTLLAYVVLRERVTRSQWGGIAMVFFGVLILSIVE